MTNIIVFGGSGYLGTECLVQLVKEGYRVINYDLKSSKVNTISSDKFAELIECKLDLSVEEVNLKVLRPILQGDPVKALICFAAWKDLPGSHMNPVEYYRNNLSILFNALNLTMALNIEKFIFSSSAGVYSDDLVGKVTEECPTNPSSPYGYSKLIGERLILEQAKVSNFTPIILRYFNPVGKTKYSVDNSESLFGSIKNSLENKLEACIFGDNYDTRDGTCIRDFIDIRDLISAHIFSITHSLNGIYNVGTGKGTTILEVMETVKEIYPDFRYRIDNPRVGDSAGGYADNTKLTECGWKPEYTLKDTIKTLLS